MAIRTDDITIKDVKAEKGKGGKSFKPVTGIIGLGDELELLGIEFNDNKLLEEFTEASVEALKDASIDIKLFKLHKDKFGLAYSFLMYASKMPDNKVYYFLALLERTGREPLTVSQVLEDAKSGNRFGLITACDAFDNEGYLDGVVKEVLKKQYGEAETISCEGIVVPYTAETQVTSPIVARMAHDLIVVKYNLLNGKQSDFSVGAIAGNFRSRLNITFNKLAKSKLGRNIAADVILDLDIEKINNTGFIHGQNTRKKLTTASAYIDYLVGEEINPYTQQIKKVAEPMLIINNAMAVAPTLNYYMLNIINATVLANRAVLRNLVINTDAGNLNAIFNYGGEPNKPGKPLDFKSMKPEEVNVVIKEHIKPNLIVALDIELYGDDYPYANAFAALADAKTAKAAKDDILTSAAILTNSEFPDVEITTEPFLLPAGEFYDSEGNLRDIREINLPFVCKHTNDMKLIYDYIFSCLPVSACMAATGMDPYILRLDVINRLSRILGIEPRVTGKILRVPLTATFINELSRRAAENGYSPQIANLDYTSSGYFNLQQVLSVYQNFAIQNTPFSPTMGSGYMNVGYGSSMYYR